MDNKGTKHNVLVVDDDEDFLFQLKSQFEAAGFGVTTAHDGKGALAAVEAARPDIAILDLMMEKADLGFTLCYRIKKKDPTIPIIMVTSVTSETGLEFDAATKEEQSWVKADILLRKPVRFEQLQREVSRLLKA